MNKLLLAALALLPVVAIGGEQVILEKDFGGNAIRKVMSVDGWPKEDCAGTATFANVSDARRAECSSRAAELVAKMSGEEKLSLLMMDSPAVPQLGIDAYHWWNEALHGVARAGLATVFPQAIGMAASFDDALMEKVGDIVSTEGRAKYNLFRAKGARGIYCGLTFWSPNVNMFRDPRWGRGQETFGEDPFLASKMGAAFVRGMQGDDAKYLKTAACAKHFAVHSGPEALRHGFDAKVSERDLREYYLPAFKALCDVGVESFMGAYSAINSTPCCADKRLLTDILRGEWGFKGHIVSDVGAIRDICSGHKFAADYTAASLMAIEAGLDLGSETAYRHLFAGVKSGAIDHKIFDAPLTRLLTTRILLGQLDPLGSTPWDGLGDGDVANAAHSAVALEMAEKSLVLVKNDGALPLDSAKVNVIGVFGPRALDEVALVGNYSGRPGQAVSCLHGITGEAGASVRTVLLGVDDISDRCDVLVACVGITSDDEGEEHGGLDQDGFSKGDRAEYAIPKKQLDELRNYRKKSKGKKMVSVVFGGSPVDLKPICELSDAVVVAWYPGEQGGRAIGRALFGKSNVFGRLPITFPQSYDDLPPFESYALEGRTYRYATKAPAFPFGYGLSYTTYEYSNASVERDGAKIVVGADVKNVGARDGEEVVQLYVRAPANAGDRRLRHLEGFKRVPLKAGEKKRVVFELDDSAISVFGDDGKMFVPDGETTFFIGGGQPGYDKGVVSSKLTF